MARSSVARRGAARSVSVAAAILVVSTLLVICGAAVFAAVVAPQGNAAAASPGGTNDSSFDAIYRRGSQLNAGMKTLSARFTETTQSSLLTRPLVTSGTVAVERPSRVVLHYQQPDVRDVLIDGDRLVIVWPGRNLRDVTNIAGANRRIQKYFVDSSPAELRSNFDITSDIPTDRPQTYHLSMLPKRKQIREGLTRLELWLDRTTLLLSAMRMTFPNGDTKLMELDGVVMNGALDPSVFSVGELPTRAPAR